MNAATTVDPPADPVSAVTHPDPYAYYASLVAERPFYRDATLGVWVASSARAVTAVLSDRTCRVRPAAEQVPKAIAGSPAAAIFGRLVRMNDGEVHPPLKRAIAAVFDVLDATRVTRASERWAALLAREVGPDTRPDLSMEFAFGLSAHVLGSLLGVPDELLPAVTRYVRDYVGCVALICSAEQIERGNSAAAQLLALFQSQYQHTATIDASTLFAELVSQAHRVGCDDPDAVIANGIGFLTQAYEAVAGLIGLTVLTLARRPDVREQVARTPELLAAVVDEVLRYDSPVQNTRRFVAEPTTIEAHELRPGETVLVVLAAANRDPLANPDPDRFDLTRRDARVFSLGAGPHACPGRRIATTITTAAVTRLLANGFVIERLHPNQPYRPSANTRIPLLDRSITAL
jgi:cytochrome P450